jgi:hypothetical protein
VTGALSAVTSRIASAGTTVASTLASVGRQVDVTFSAGALENARSALAERERTVRLRSVVDGAYQSMEFDRSA